MRRKWLIAGNDGVGKTSLASLIEDKNIKSKKSLDFQFREKTIEVSEGYIENPYLNSALIMVGQNQSLVNIFMIDLQQDCHFPPNFAKSFTRPTITIINKIDLYDDVKLEKLRQIANAIGSDYIFEISLKTGKGLEKLRKYIKETEEKRCFL